MDLRVLFQVHTIVCGPESVLLFQVHTIACEPESVLFQVHTLAACGPESVLFQVHTLTCGPESVLLFQVNAKYSEDQAEEVLCWIKEVLKDEDFSTSGDADNFYEVLKSGQVLCK